MTPVRDWRRALLPVCRLSWNGPWPLAWCSHGDLAGPCIRHKSHWNSSDRVCHSFRGNWDNHGIGIAPQGRPTRSSVKFPVWTRPAAGYWLNGTRLPLSGGNMNQVFSKLGSCFSTSTTAMGDHPVTFWEGVVCPLSDLVPGQMKQVQLQGDHSCILIQESDGAIHALSSKCTHYGANLINGTYHDGVIRCPWHGACFKASTGDIEDFPGLDSLHKYEVRVDSDQNVVVKMAQPLLGEKRRVKPLGQRDPNNLEVVVIIGGGASAEACAETLRQDNNFTGEIIVLTQEDLLPYDRPKLSKALSIDVENIQLRNPAYYHLGDIDIRTSSQVTDLNTKSKEVTLASGATIKFDKLVIASGTSPRRLNDVPGANLENIMVLRSPSDGQAIEAKGRNKKVAIIGTSFIGMEVAAYLADKAQTVTLIGNSEFPFERSLGPDIGKMVRSMHEAKGVSFQMGQGSKEFLDNGSGAVSGIRLEDGTEIQADLVVLGVGVEPNNQFIPQDCDLELTQDGYVKVNDHLETNIKGIYCVGDMAAFPLFLTESPEENLVHIGHWQLAHAHGRRAALNLCGKNEPIKSVPFFWTVQYGKSIRYAGFSPDYDDIVFDGRPEDGKFAAYYCKGDRVDAIATLMRDPLAAEFADLLRAGQTLKKDQVLTDWHKIY
ncbi:hypothetical protein TCAL_00834 [Tigriopus californicus]|uniref:Rieske domain-containing protein n=1 Tax=Tigriopus californicus TaxID=6832 RepID=A0A553NEN1_TIGCA|nr:apoptosis-inducing factor 3-like [Tigriopus californicus]TRY63900.1 hypothetical protein TCAL_00834 [Tigriopus californicus]|eukprot:TCALIF_00834-PA protein Name:"Similar to AIFM3 Apoptosis-inducing factor 3 (Homo sapiens)" AED:0.14 eAED:0.14 QI:254/1/1/1/1/1/2/263/658